MAARNHRRHAGGADLADIGGIRPQRRQGKSVILVGGKGAHRRSQPGIGFELSGLFEIGLGQRADLGREAVGPDLFDRLGQLDNGVVGPRGGAVAARIGDFQLVVVIGLFRALPGPVKRLAAGLFEQPAAAIDVDDHFRIFQPLRDQAAGLHRRFFIARELEDDRSARAIAGLAHGDQGGRGQRRVELHVAGTAAEQIAVLDHRSEGIAGPVLGVGFDHVHVARDHQRLQPGIAAFPGGDQIGGVVDRHDLHVAVAPAGRHQCGLKRLLGFCRAVVRSANRANRDQLLGKIEHLSLRPRRIDCRSLGQAGRGGNCHECGE